MASPNLAITHVAAAQNQKEVTVNDAIDALDRALTDALVVSHMWWKFPVGGLRAG
jgi:hypothetical protein